MQHVRCAALLLLLPCIALAQTRPDSMTVQIGEKAKIIFVAQQPGGFEEIAPYDLNAVFEQVWNQKKLAQGASTQQLSAKQAKKLRNDAYEKPVAKRPFFEKRIYANAFVGMAFLSEVRSYRVARSGGNALLVSGQINSIRQVEPRGIAGIGGFANLNLTENGRYLWSVRYGLGVDYFSYDKGIFNIEQGVIKIYDGMNDTIGTVSNRTIIRQFGFVKTHIVYPHLSCMPILYKKNAAGQKTWNIGLGFRAGPALEISDVNIASGSIASNPSNPILMQYSLTGQIGWKYLALFYHYKNGGNNFSNCHAVGIRVGY